MAAVLRYFQQPQFLDPRIDSSEAIPGTEYIIDNNTFGLFATNGLEIRYDVTNFSASARIVNFQVFTTGGNILASMEGINIPISVIQSGQTDSFFQGLDIVGIGTNLDDNFNFHRFDGSSLIPLGSQSLDGAGGFDTFDTRQGIENLNVTQISGNSYLLRNLVTGEALSVSNFEALRLADGSIIAINDAVRATNPTSAPPQVPPVSTPPTNKPALFDDAFYLTQNPDVAAANADPFSHYNAFGWREGRDPNQFFDTSYYLARNQDIAAAGVNPLEHFIAFGWREGRDPSQTFDTSFYLQRYPDIAAAGVNPLEHYVIFGVNEGRVPLELAL